MKGYMPGKGKVLFLDKSVGKKVIKFAILIIERITVWCPSIKYGH